MPLRSLSARALIVALLATGAGHALLSAAEPSGFRQLAPGALTVIPPQKGTDSAVLRADVVEITEGQQGLAWVPQQASPHTTFVERGKGREYPRDICCLEFAFKPPRQIDVDVPSSNLTMRRKRLWYLVYRVRNVPGRRVIVESEAMKDAPPDAPEAEKVRHRVEPFEGPYRFLPHFVLESLEPVKPEEGMVSYRAYLDRLVPSAMDAIRTREDPKRRFFDSVEMSATPMQPGEERWGVAIWEDVDPRIDFFSIYVQGLTNAIRWRPRPGSVIRPQDPPGAHIEETFESLRLDFWHPGDDRHPNDGEMSVGSVGLFERKTLGGKLLRVAGWPRHASVRPAEGLDALGLHWTSLLEPAGGSVPNLMPLETLLRRASDAKASVDPIVALRAVMGDVGVASVEELIAAAAGPVDSEQDARRRAALQAVGLSPEAVSRAPLASLATIMRSLESAADRSARDAAADAFFGSASRRIDWLADAVANARGVAALRSIDAPITAITAGDARAALDAFRPAVDGLHEDERKQILDGMAANDPRRLQIEALEGDARNQAVADLVLQGLFGALGPKLYADAVAQHEGIDYAWVFRYETEGAGN